MDVPSEQRCKKSAGSWRCREKALSGKSSCKKHCPQMKNQSMKRKQREKEVEEARSDSGEGAEDRITGRRGDDDKFIGLRKSRTGDRKKRKIRSGIDGSDEDASETEFEFDRILARKEKKLFSIYESKKLNREDDKDLSRSGEGLAKSGEGQSNSSEGKGKSAKGRRKSNQGQWNSAKVIKSCRSGEKKPIEKEKTSGDELEKEDVYCNKESDNFCKGARTVSQGKRNSQVLKSWNLGNGVLDMKLLDKSNKNKKPGSLMCHQCQRNDKSGVVFCSKCPKRYCYECVGRWKHYQQGFLRSDNGDEFVSHPF